MNKNIKNGGIKMFKKTLKTILTTALAITVFASNAMTASAAPMRVSVSDLFDAEYYAEQNPDVKAAFGNDERALLNHYLQHGMKEGRNFSKAFNLTLYKKLYSDLAQVFGNNWEMYVTHYLNYGVNESRDGGGEFDIVAYMKNNPDVVDAFGLNFAAIKNHYESFGKAEGRVAISPVLQAKKEAATQAAKSAGTSNSDSNKSSSSDSYSPSSGIEILLQDGVYYNYTAYCNARDAWEASEPAMEDYIDMEAYDAAIAAWEATAPDEDDYIFAYENEEAANAAYEKAHEEWEENAPNPDDYTTEEYAEVFEAYCEKHPEPSDSDYQYFTDGYDSEEAARNWFTVMHGDWEEHFDDALLGYEEGTPEYEQVRNDYLASEPVIDDFLGLVNVYGSEEEATDAYDDAYTEWENNAPDPSEYHDEESYAEALEEHNATEPQREDFVTEEEMGEGFTNTYESAEDAKLAYDEAYTKWSDEMPDAGEFGDTTEYDKLFSEWEAAEPKLEDFEIEEEDIPAGSVITEPVG